MLSQKSAPLVEIKTNKTPGEFTAVISAIGNVDHDGDRVMPGAFEKAISEDPVPPVYWAHKHDIPPIGEGLEWEEKDDQVIYSGRLFVKGDVEHPFANMCYAGMKSYEGRPTALKQFSYTYGVPEGGSERVVEGSKSIRNLLEIRPVVEVGPCFLGSNDLTHLVAAAKAADLSPMETAQAAAALAEFDFFQLGTKGEWTTEYINGLPDSAFLHVEGEGVLDSSGKTEPRSLRHFPYKNAQGKIDMPRLRDAITQVSQDEALDEKARESVEIRAQRLLRAQEGKALLLGTIFSAKAWNDIEGYSVYQILEMLDSAVSYIQMEEDAADVAAMQQISQSLLALLQTDFDETSTSKSATKAAAQMAISLYEMASESPVLSEMASKVTDKEIARLLLVGPQH